MYPPVKWVLFKEGNLQIGRSNARVLVRAWHILGALKYPRLDSASDQKNQPWWDLYLRWGDEGGCWDPIVRVASHLVLLNKILPIIVLTSSS